MLQPLEIVKQTGNTIIFEKFNDDIIGLDNLLTRDIVQLPVAKFAEENLTGKDALLKVTSFKEFVEKFAPTVYETVVMDDKGQPKFVYSLEKPNNAYNVIKLTDHAFYKMIMNLLDRKANSSEYIKDFPYDDLKKALTPEAVFDEFKKIRKNLISNAQELDKLEAKGEPSLDIERFQNNIEQGLLDIKKTYEGKSPLALLPFYIRDTQAKLDKLDEVKLSSDSSSSPTIATFQITDKGELICIPYDGTNEEENSLDSKALVVGTTCSSLAKWVKDDFTETAPTAINNEFVCNLVANVFVPTNSGSNGNCLTVAMRPELESKKAQYLSIYQTSLQSFADAVSKVIEKFAGVKSFFDHAVDKNGNLPKDVSVIISNCKASAIVSDNKAKERFESYFVNTLSKQKDSNRIWFAIIPAIDSNNTDTKAEIGKSHFPRKNENTSGKSHFPRKNENTSGKTNSEQLVSLAYAKDMLSLLEKANIMTFMNFKADENSVFSSLTRNFVEEYKKKFAEWDFEYGVFTYPNFTILPREKSSVNLGKIAIYKESENLQTAEPSEAKPIKAEIVTEDAKTETNQNADSDEVVKATVEAPKANDFVLECEKNAYVVLPGVFLDASYVAAGLIVGTQNPKLLNEKFKVLNRKANDKYPCVRFDIEDNYNVIPTRMNRETPIEIDSATKECINEDCFGFSFADDKQMDATKSRILNSCYVYKARTLKKDAKGNYKKLYKSLVKILVDQILRSIDKTITENSVEDFLDEYADEWRNDNKDDSKNYVNKLLCAGERIKINKESGHPTLSICFNNEEEIWDDINIEDTVSSESGENKQ